MPSHSLPPVTGSPQGKQMIKNDSNSAGEGEIKSVCKRAEKPSTGDGGIRVTGAPCDVNPAVFCWSFRQLSRAAPAFPGVGLTLSLQLVSRVPV